jgi:integrase
LNSPILIPKKNSFCEFDAQATQPEQSSGDEISQLLEKWHSSFIQRFPAGRWLCSLLVDDFLKSLHPYPVHVAQGDWLISSATQISFMVLTPTPIAASLEVLTISRRLGHGSPAITLNVYGHLFRPDDRAAAIIEKALAGTEEG